MQRAYLGQDKYVILLAQRVSMNSEPLEGTHFSRSDLMPPLKYLIGGKRVPNGPRPRVVRIIFPQPPHSPICERRLLPLNMPILDQTSVHDLLHVVRFHYFPYSALLSRNEFSPIFDSFARV